MKALLLATALIAAAHVQASSLVNAEINDMSGIDDPAAAVEAVEDGWFAFAYPAVEGRHSPCCWQGDPVRAATIGCSLHRDFQSYGTLSTAPVEDTIVAYVRVEDGSVDRVKVAGRQCPMDGGGRSVTWIGDTDVGRTLAWLENLARNGHEDRAANPALWALALHASGKATERLEALARAPGDELAGESIFWLGEARGDAGFEALEALLDALPPGERRRQISFALGQNGSDQAAVLLARIARNDPDPEQRGQALFWLAQSYPETAQPVILGAIHGERDEETLEQAVFALSQLPDAVAGPALMDIARDSDAPRSARRQALFWLAHEGDEETVTALTEMLTR